MRICEECSAELPATAPQGLCPKCLLRMVIGPALPGVAGPPALAAPGSWTPLTERMRRFGDYELLEEIARGGMGVVHRARQVSLNRIVAVKMLLFGRFASAEFVQRFRAEATAAASLQHPNIVQIHEVGRHDGQDYFSMDFVPGMNLADLVRDRPLPARRAASYLKTIAAAVHYAHQHGVLHRDLKPSNVLIDESDQPRVTDFGLAKQLNAEGGFTTTGHVLGSPSYVPPEQAAGNRGETGVRSDVYSLGSILYHLLTGRPPFIGETVPEILDQVLRQEPVAPRLLNPGVPLDLQTICLKCLEKNVQRRYASAQALEEDLDRFLHDKPILARPLGAAQKVARWCRREPALAGVVVLLVAFSAGAAWTALHLQWMQARLRRSLSVSATLRDQMRKSLYVSDMNLALRDFEEGNTAQAQARLKHHLSASGQPDLRAFEWRYLWGQCRGDYTLWLPKHGQIAGAIRFSPDGKYVAVFTWNGKVTVWELAARRQLFATAEVSGFGGFLSDSRTLVLGRGDGSLQFCDAETGVTNRRVAASGQLVALAADSAVVVTVSSETGLTVLDAGDGQARFTLPGFTRSRLDYGWGFPGAISPNGKLLALVESDPNPLKFDLAVRVWDLPARRELRRLPLNCEVRSLAFSAEGTVLAVGDGTGNLFLWNLAQAQGQAIVRKAHEFPILSLAFSLDGRALATGSSDKHSIRLWNVADGTPRARTFSGQVGDVWSLAFSPDGSLLASGTRDGPIRFWSLAEREAREIVEEHIFAHKYGNVIFSPDSQWMAAGCEGNVVKIWEVATLRLRTILTNTTYVVAFARDSQRVLVSTTGGLPHWASLNSPSSSSVPPYPGNIDNISAVDFSADRRIAAVGLRSGAMQLLEIETGRSAGPPLEPHASAVRSLALSSAGRFLVSGGNDHQLIVSDLKTGAVLGRSYEHKGSVCAVAISPDGNTLASGCAAETIKFWNPRNLSTGAMASISYHKSVIRTLAFSPDGLTLASGSEDNTVKLWSVALRAEVASFKHEDHVRLVVFSPDGNSLATVTDRGTLRLFRAPGLKEADELARN